MKEEKWFVMEGIAPGGGIGIGPEIEGIGPHTIVNYTGGDAEERAEFLVRACNTHDRLVKALEEVKNDFDNCGGCVFNNTMTLVNIALEAAKKGE